MTYDRTGNKNAVKHGMCGTRFYRCYQSAKDRCTNPKGQDFAYYGGRGIEFRWKSFEQFKEDMLEGYLEHCKSFGIKDTTLDRLDFNGHYCRKNCSWATRLVQAHNRRKRNLSLMKRDGLGRYC